MKFETTAVHSGGGRDSSYSVAPPIQLSTTFEHGPAGEQPGGHLYIRYSNPTQVRLEEALAALEDGEGALAFSSGVAAGAAIAQAISPGSHVVFPDDIYYNFRLLAADFFPRWGLEASFVDMGDERALAAAIRPTTRMIWAESPSNPLLKVTDLSAVVRAARAANALTLVDNTFATPALQRPIPQGFDLVMHSTTKYMGGHSDVQGGALVFARRDALYSGVRKIRDVQGAVASPFNSWLILRGLRTLPCRVEKHSENALAVARFLESHPAVERVFYPGLASHPGHEAARRQMSAFGGMLSFRVRGGREAAIRAASRVRLFVNATSLGGTESLIEHRASSEGPTSTTPQDLLRASIGLEHPDDLIDDLRQALET